MSAEDLDNYETDAELALYREYRDVIKLFKYVVETERRFYLANKVDFNVRSAGQMIRDILRTKIHIQFMNIFIITLIF